MQWKNKILEYSIWWDDRLRFNSSLQETIGPTFEEDEIFRDMRVGEESGTDWKSTDSMDQMPSFIL